jgi:ribosome-associated heat shock protein Hsp15
MKKIRIDKWLWVVRIYKTRAEASNACKGGKVKIDMKKMKPSRILEGNEIITVQKKFIKETFKVVNSNKNRINPKIKNDFVINLTPEEEYLKIKINNYYSITREKGLGRPTKKERRMMDKTKSKFT